MLSRLLQLFASRSASAEPVTEIVELRTPEERAHQLLDENAIARELEGRDLGIDERIRILLRIIVGGTEQLVADRERLIDALNNSLTLLRGAPGAGDLRIRKAIAILELQSPTKPARRPAQDASAGGTGARPT